MEKLEQTDLPSQSIDESLMARTFWPDFGASLRFQLMQWTDTGPCTLVPLLARLGARECSARPGRAQHYDRLTCLSKNKHFTISHTAPPAAASQNIDASV